LVFPPSSASGEGRLSQGGKAKFVTSLVLSRARGQGSKQKSSESAENLASRNLRTLDGVPRSGRMGRGTTKKHSPASRKKSKADLADMAITLEILKS